MNKKTYWKNCISCAQVNGIWESNRITMKYGGSMGVYHSFWIASGPACVAN